MCAGTTLKSNLKEASRVQITAVIDNYSDSLLASSEAKSDLVTRYPRRLDERTPDEGLLAEHGLCLFIRLFNGDQEHTILFDSGRTRLGVGRNLGVLGIDLTRLEAIVLSHGHADHYGGLNRVIKYLNGSSMPLIAHPDAFLNRYNELSDGTLMKRGRLVERTLEKAGVPIVKNKAPYLLASNLLAVTGEVERVTDFETISAHRYIKRDGKLEHDLIRDDQSLVLNLKGKGLVVISGCAHAGIINTIRYARKITGIERVHAVLGGFHLTGPKMETQIEKTVRELAEINPTVVVPMHCTSWKSTLRIYQAMPQAFILSSVGTRFNLGSRHSSRDQAANSN